MRKLKTRTVQTHLSWWTEERLRAHVWLSWRLSLLSESPRNKFNSVTRHQFLEQLTTTLWRNNAVLHASKKRRHKLTSGTPMNVCSCQQKNLNHQTIYTDSTSKSIPRPLLQTLTSPAREGIVKTTNLRIGAFGSHEEAPYSHQRQA